MVVLTDLQIHRSARTDIETVGNDVSREDQDMPAPVAAPDTGPAEASPNGALSRLIKEANDAGLSYGQMAERAIDPRSGEGVSKQYLQKIAQTPPAKPPTPTQLRAIAVALRHPENRVKEAAAEQWLEYEATQLAGYDEDVRIILGHLAGKSKSDLRRWRRMVEAEDQAQRED
jgi:hypothetical protein